MSRGRNFKFTMDYNKEQWDFLSKLQTYRLCSYLVQYKENLKIHGYIKFTNPRYLSAVKTLLRETAEVELTKLEPSTFKLAIGNNPHFESGPLKKKKHEIIEENAQLKNENATIKTQLNGFMESFGEEKMKQLMEICLTVAKNNPTTTNIINNVNNVNNGTINNNRFNLNMFLNEHCKDAMDIYDFINGIDINLDDILAFKRLSHAEAVARIFDKAYKDVEVSKRPIHCTDLKRETFYVRNEKQWINDETKKLTEKAMNILSSRSFNNLYQWKVANPDYMNDEDLKTEYATLMRSVLGAVYDWQFEENYKTFIHKIAKTIYIDKPAAMALMR